MNSFLDLFKWSKWFTSPTPTDLGEVNGAFFYVLNTTEQEIDFKNLKKIFFSVPHLRIVIEEKAKLFSNARFVVKKRDSEDQILYDHPLASKLNNPNLFQNQRQFLFMVSAYQSICGDSFIKANYGVGTNIRNLINMTPVDFDSMVIKKKHNTYAFEVITDVTDYIEHYLFNMDGGMRKFMPNEVIHIRESGVKFDEGQSKITTLRTNLLNIMEALDARKTMIRRKGGIGALVGNQKDGGMSVPLSPKEKQTIQDSLNNYGTGSDKNSIIVTDVNMRWQPFVFPTRDLMLFEEIEDDFHTICDSYGLSRELFEGQSNFSNKEHAERATYQNTIIPMWEDFKQKMNAKLNTQSEGIEIDYTIDHIAILQESEQEKTQAQKLKSDMLLQELDRNIITVDEYRSQMGYMR